MKEIEPGSLNSMVPSMLLQPLVENSIKHGLSPRIEGGSITLRSRLTDDRLTIELEDDGVGMSSSDGWEESVWPSSGGTGIGMQNVIERLKVLYGDAASMTVRSRDGSGTVVSLELPRMDEAAVAELTPAALPASSVAARYVTRSSTLR